MEKMIKLVPREDNSTEPIPSVVACVEELLEYAKDGKLRGILTVGVMLDDHVSTTMAPGEGTAAEFVLALEVLKLRILEEVL